MSYFARLTRGRIVLWCYLIWYLFFAARYFDPSRDLWLTSLGLSGVIGLALFISTAGGDSRLGRWQVIRLFLMPFCVSSFSALVKGRGFILIFSPRLEEILIALAFCGLLCGTVVILKRQAPAPRVS